MFMHKNSENYEEMAEGMRIISLLPDETKMVTLYTQDWCGCAGGRCMLEFY